MGGGVVAGGLGVSVVTPSTMSPTVRRVLRASSGISMLKASSTSKEMLILSRESMLSSSKVLAREMVSAGMLFDLAMMSMQRAAMSFMLLRRPGIAPTYREASAAVKVVWLRLINFSLSAGVIRLQAIRQYAKRARSMADVEMEEIFEEGGATLKGAKGECAEVGETVEEEQAAGHDARWALDVWVDTFIGGEVFDVERSGERNRLTEAEAETGAGDGVD